MPQKISVTRVPQVFDPYSAFKTPYQKQLLQLFRDGATFYVWRCSSPHNWYLETADGAQYMVDGDYESCAADGVGRYQREALMRLARHSFTSATRVTRGHRFENGLPEQEGWQFDADLARQAEQHWAAFQAELASRAAAVKPPAPDMGRLSELALALLRRLQLEGFGLPRYPELASAFAELDAQGLLELTSTGKLRLPESLPKLRVPRGMSLQPV
jgi:hypothetical protein